MRETAEIVNSAAQALANIIFGMREVNFFAKLAARARKRMREPRLNSKFRLCARARR